ncbi:MAG: hypothetical protein ACRDOD_17400 [Streptosporangiaceae bacterium]
MLCRYILQLPPVVAMDAGMLAASIAPLLQHFLTGSLAGDPSSLAPGRGDRRTVGEAAKQ